MGKRAANLQNKRALLMFFEAQKHYCAERFFEARLAITSYRRLIDYQRFNFTDKRSTIDPAITIIIVSYSSGHHLIDCVHSILKQKIQKKEIIVVDNGGNNEVHLILSKLPILWITPPINLLPSEGRNLGAFFAKGDLIVFLDDDAIMSSNYLESACSAMMDKSIIALRGRVQPKSNTTNPPFHYDLGSAPHPAELNLEGNLVIRKWAFKDVGGFDPLMFGHEGKELTHRLKLRFPNKDIYYYPTLLIQHDFAVSHYLEEKLKRQKRGITYMQYLKNIHLNNGITIIVRTKDNFIDAKNFLTSLYTYNTHNSLEVLLLADDAHEALNLIRPYCTKLYIRILTTHSNNFISIIHKARYENIFIIDIPTTLNADVISKWIQHENTDPNTILIYKKHQISPQLEVRADLNLKELNSIINQNNVSKSINKNQIDENITITTKNINSNKTESSSILCDNKMSRVIAGMATIPQRLKTLPDILSRISHQFDEIHVYLNGHKTKPLFPEYNNIIFHLCDNYGDLGAKGKFFGLKHTTSNDYYFSLDDDFYYPNDYVKNMINALKRYDNKVGVCVHGSIFGDPLDWYFERTSTFSSKQELLCDRFVNLAGTGTFACKLSTLPLEFIDVMPRTMCDLQISIKAKNLNVPLVSIKRQRQWLSTIKIDSVTDSGNDYWTKMLMDDAGRTEVAQREKWNFSFCKDYIISSLIKANIPTHDYKKLTAEFYDVAFIKAANNKKTPPLWDSSNNETYYLRKYQYYQNLLNGTQNNRSRDEILRKPKYSSTTELKKIALDHQKQWKDQLNGCF